MKRRLLDWLIPHLIHLIHLVLRLTVRWEYFGERYKAGQQQRFILAFWHGRGLMMPYAFRGWPGYVLMSEHRDGGFISDAVNLMGIKTLRGSSTRGGARAVLQMLRVASKENCDLGITPDGPKGPREVVKEGIVQLALKTGYPVLPVCYAAKRYWRAKSWDQFYVPKPFTRGVFCFGEYIYLNPEDSTAVSVARVQQALDAVQKQADSYFLD